MSPFYRRPGRARKPPTARGGHQALQPRRHHDQPRRQPSTRPRDLRGPPKPPRYKAFWKNKKLHSTIAPAPGEAQQRWERQARQERRERRERREHLERRAERARAASEEIIQALPCWTTSTAGATTTAKSIMAEALASNYATLRAGPTTTARSTTAGALVSNYATLRAARCRELPHAPPRPRAAARARPTNAQSHPRARAPPAHAGALNSRTAPGQHRAKPERRTTLAAAPARHARPAGATGDSDRKRPASGDAVGTANQ